MRRYRLVAPYQKILNYENEQTTGDKTNCRLKLAAHERYKWESIKHVQQN